MLHQADKPRSLAVRAWNIGLDIIFPPRCVGCEKFAAFLCEECAGNMARAAPPRCFVCWMPGGAEACARCRQGAPSFTAARSAFVYEDTARKAVLALKFRGVSAVAGAMGREMARCLVDWDPPVDVIVPVPLGGQRRRLRGYNQAELLAKEIARSTDLPLETRALVRSKATAPQAQQSGEEARYENVAAAFEPGSRRISGRILLVDDVMTTGATLAACASVLLDGGAEAVYALTFARDD